MNNQVENNGRTLDQQLDEQLNTSLGDAPENAKPINEEKEDKKQSGEHTDKSTRILSVGEWMLTLFFFIIPAVNIIMMAYWAFSSGGNVNRRNLSRAGLLWLIILLIAYVVAMTAAGFTPFMLFGQ